MAWVWDFGMSYRPKDPVVAADRPNGRESARRRPSVIVVLVVGLFAGGAAICTALIAPILWAAASDAVQQSRSAYQPCAAVTEDARRLACYDRVLRQKSPHSTKQAGAVPYMPPL